MTQSPADETAADETAIEKACRDIDRYIAETSLRPINRDQSLANDSQPISPSQRLQALGRQGAGSFKSQLAASNSPFTPLD